MRKKVNDHDWKLKWAVHFPLNFCQQIIFFPNVRLACLRGNVLNRVNGAAGPTPCTNEKLLIYSQLFRSNIPYNIIVIWITNSCSITFTVTKSTFKPTVCAMLHITKTILIQWGVRHLAATQTTGLLPWLNWHLPVPHLRDLRNSGFMKYQ